MHPWAGGLNPLVAGGLNPLVAGGLNPLVAARTVRGGKRNKRTNDEGARYGISDKIKKKKKGSRRTPMLPYPSGRWAESSEA